MTHDLHPLRMLRPAIALGIVSASGSALAVSNSIQWLPMSFPLTVAPPPLTGTYPSYVPGVGPVTMTYSAGAGFSDARVAIQTLQSGSVLAPNQVDTYDWGFQILLARTYLTQTPPPSGAGSGLNQSWEVNYQFSQPMAAGTQLVLGVMGLGRRLPNDPSETLAETTTTATVGFGAGNDINLGDYTGGSNWGQTLVTSQGPGSLTMVNSQNGFGGIDPWWNTGLNLTVFTNPQAMNSLTVRFDQTLGDGVGVNIGFINAVPEPGTWALLAAGLAAVGWLGRRRERA